MKLLNICLGFKMKTLSGDYHQLLLKRFLKFFAVNLKLIPLHHGNQIDQCASCHFDRNEIAIDAFSILRSELNFSNVFPPLSLIGAAIAKVR